MTSGAAAQGLTARERDVVEAASGGATVREISDKLGISARTVEHHLTSAYRKLGVRSRGELIAQRGSTRVQLPTTHYARVGGAGVAYQVVGNGPRAVVFVPGFVSNVEAAWEWPAQAQFLRRLADGRRLVLFDKRGTGLSDRLADPTAVTMDERMAEVRAVMDAAHVERGTVLGFSEGAALAMLFAASHPERVNGLILYGALISSSFRDPASRLARVAADPEGTRTMYLQHWGSGRVLAAAVPSALADPELLEHVARFERAGAGPADAHAISRMAAAIELRSLAPAIPVPTLVIHRREDALVPVENARFLAAHLPYARYVELPGEEHPPWLGPVDHVWRALDPFLAVDHPAPRERPATLTTLVRTHPLLAPTQLPLLGAHLGRAVATRPGLAYAFDGPARALGFARALQEREPGTRIAVHCGEVSITPTGFSGAAAEVAAAALNAAAPGELLVTRTVKDLTLGSRLEFARAGSLEALGTMIDTFHVAAAR